MKTFEEILLEQIKDAANEQDIYPSQIILEKRTEEVMEKIAKSFACNITPTEFLEMERILQ